MNEKEPKRVTGIGGYSPEIKTIIEAHTNTYRVAHDIFSRNKSNFHHHSQ